jgi:hypothetical protein
MRKEWSETHYIMQIIRTIAKLKMDTYYANKEFILERKAETYHARIFYSD